MRIYLCRHGEALPAQRDAARPLSERGREQLRALARAIAPARAVRVDEVRHSPKLRAQQTAQLLARELGLEVPVVSVPGLAPHDDVHALRTELLAERRNLLLVGHLPFLAELASLLVCGRAEPARFVFVPGTLLCLQAAAGSESFDVMWMLTPALFRGSHAG